MKPKIYKQCGKWCIMLRRVQIAKNFDNWIDALKYLEYLYKVNA